MDAEIRNRFTVEEYIQTSIDWRHRDVRLWQLPTVLVAVAGALVAQSFELPDDAPQWVQSVILGFGAGFAFCLTFALGQNLGIQDKNAKNLQVINPRTQRFGFTRAGSWLLFSFSVFVVIVLLGIFFLSIFGGLT